MLFKIPNNCLEAVGRYVRVNLSAGMCGSCYVTNHLNHTWCVLFMCRLWKVNWKYVIGFGFLCHVMILLQLLLFKDFGSGELGPKPSPSDLKNTLFFRVPILKGKSHSITFPNRQRMPKISVFLKYRYATISSRKTVQSRKPVRSLFFSCHFFHLKIFSSLFKSY